MSKENLLTIPCELAKDTLKLIDNIDAKKFITENAILSAEPEIKDMGLSVSNVKVNYPIKMELYEDGTAKCYVSIIC